MKPRYTCLNKECRHVVEGIVDKCPKCGCPYLISDLTFEGDTNEPKKT